MRLQKTLWMFALVVGLGTVTSEGGALRRAFFNNNGLGIAGNTIADLIAATDFARNGGASSELLTESFWNVQGGVNSDDGLNNFGSLTRGYVEAPLTGTYTIFLGSDDNAELYWGADHQVFAFRDPARLIAFESGYTSGDIYTAARIEERSGPVTLEAGKKYFVELLHKEGSGGSFIQVAWERPDGVRETIPGYVLAPYGSSFDLSQEASTIEVTVPPPNFYVMEGAPIVFQVVAYAKQPTAYQWLEGATPIAGATNAWYATKARLVDNGKAYSLRITDGNGATVTSPPGGLTVEADVVAPSLVRARGSASPHGIIVTYSEAVDPGSATNAAHYQLTGQTLAVQTIRMLSDREVLFDVGEFTSAPLTLTVSNVKDPSAAGNTIAPDSQALVRFQNTLDAYWDFNDATGTTVKDLVAKQDGEIYGGAFFTTDKPALGARANPYAMAFNGMDSYVLTTCPGVEGKLARTVSFWVKTMDTNNHRIVCWGDSRVDGHKYHVRIEPATGTLRTEVQGGNGLGTQPITNNVWRHVVSLLPELDAPNARDILHYVDGVLDPQSGATAQAIDTDVAGPNARPVWVGAGLQGTSATPLFFNGLVDDLAIYRTALTAAQIAQLAAGADPRDFAAAMTGALTISQQPASAVADELSSVTFGIAVTGSYRSAVGYQWYRDGQPIPGATAASYTIQAHIADHGAAFKAETFNLDGTYARLTSDTVTLSVVTDVAPPQVVEIRGISGGINQVHLQFNEGLEAASATNLAAYQITGTAGIVPVISAALSGGGTNVILRTGVLEDGDYTLAINGLKDLAAAGNTLTTNAAFAASVTYPEQVLADQPVRYWRLGETGGTVAYSEVAGVDTDIHGTYTGGVTLGQTTLVPSATNNTAAGFSSSASQVITVPNGDDININAGPWAKKTIELWFRASAAPPLGATGRAAATKGLFEQGGGTRGLSLYIWQDPTNTDPLVGTLVFGGHNNASDGAGAPWGVAANLPDLAKYVAHPVQVGKLYHVVGVMDGDNTGLNGQLILYVNGVEVGRTNGIGQLYNHTDDVQIGRGTVRIHTAQTGTLGYFDGVIDDVAYYNTALSAERISRHYQTALAGGALDAEAPKVLSVRGVAGAVNQITIRFDEKIDAVSAGNPNNYRVNGAAALGAILSLDGMTVRLTVAPLAAGTSYTLNINGVKDVSIMGNPLTANVSFQAEAPTYADHVLLDNPVRYWRFGELAGTAALSEATGSDSDTAGTYLNGVGLGALSLVANTPDNAASSFRSASSQSISFPDGSDLNAKAGPWSKKSIELWFRAASFPETNATGLNAATGLYEEGGGNRALSLYLYRAPTNANPNEALLVFDAHNNIDTDGSGVGVPWGVSSTAPENALYVAYPVQAGPVYHVVAVMDGDEFRTGNLVLYVNGQEAGRIGGVGLLYNHTGDIQIGRGNVMIHTGVSGNLAYFDGVMDDVSLYNAALTPAQVTAHYQAGLVLSAKPRVVSVDPEPGAVNVVSGAPVTITLANGQTAVDTQSIVLRVDGTAVAPQITPQGNQTLVAFSLGTLASAEMQTVHLEWNGLPSPYEWSFRSMVILPEAWAAPLGSGTNAGFRVRTEQADAAAGLTNGTERAEAQLSSPPQPPSVFSGSGVFPVINFNIDENGNAGVFRADTGFPDQGLVSAGLISSLTHTTMVSMEIVVYLEFTEAGIYRMGVNSDDGFRLTAGRLAADQTLELGVHDGGRGATTADPQSPFEFQVAKPGVYAFRMIWYQGTGGGSVEWTVKDAAGVSRLLNGGGSPVKAYTARTQDPPPETVEVTLQIQMAGNDVIISWDPVAGTLQSAPAVDGPWTNVTSTSPHQTTAAGTQFFRVK
ncbi:MAG TPA: Ig-like domain-containing protein [Candidatus Paceibacterota bacterium]|nr:Ig-like domain-containing protein [Verrucomicrobiota bacterium]HRZ46053.1 Ig-like domain-containing protein [Candidatus Paceibacterota bacterium]